MRSGQLRSRITFQEPIETRDNYGSVTITWSDVATISASMWPISGKEYVSMAQTQSAVTTRIWLRYRVDLNTKMRIKFKDRIFNILQIINPDERNIMLEMVCAEEVD